MTVTITAWNDTDPSSPGSGHAEGFKRPLFARLAVLAALALHAVDDAMPDAGTTDPQPENTTPPLARGNVEAALGAAMVADGLEGDTFPLTGPDGGDPVPACPPQGTDPAIVVIEDAGLNVATADDGPDAPHTFHRPPADVCAVAVAAAWDGMGYTAEPSQAAVDAFTQALEAMGYPEAPTA